MRAMSHQRAGAFLLLGHERHRWERRAYSQSEALRYNHVVKHEITQFSDLMSLFDISKPSLKVFVNTQTRSEEKEKTRSLLSTFSNLNQPTEQPDPANSYSNS